MSIRPADMQIVMPRAAEPRNVSRDGARPDLQTQQFAQQLQKQVQLEQQQVVQPHKTEKEERDIVDKDGRNKQDAERKKKEQAKKKTGALTREEKPKPGESLFDMTV